MNRTPTPTRHGNWQVIDGQLVDVDQVAPRSPAPAAAAAAPQIHTPESASPARGRRHRNKRK